MLASISVIVEMRSVWICSAVHLMFCSIMLSNNVTLLMIRVDNRGRVSYCLYWADAWARISWKSRSILPPYTCCMNIINQMTWAWLHVTVKRVLRVEISQSWLILKIHHQLLTPLYWFLPQYLPWAASSTVDSTSLVIDHAQVIWIMVFIQRVYGGKTERDFQLVRAHASAQYRQ